MTTPTQFSEQPAVIEEPVRILFSVRAFYCASCEAKHWGLYAGFVTEEIRHEKSAEIKRLTSVPLGNYKSRDAAMEAIGSTYVYMWYMISDIVPMVQELNEDGTCKAIKQLEDKYITAEDTEIVRTH